MELYSSAGSVANGVEYAKSSGRKRVDVVDPCLCVWGTTTPETFYSALQSGDVWSGALNRWQVFEGDVSATMGEPDFSAGLDRAPPVELTDWLKRVASLPHPEDGACRRHDGGREHRP